MSHAINNFCGHSPAFVSSNLHADCGPLVTLRQDSGSCAFHHSMTPLQAREMALRLNDEADNIEEAAQQLKGVPA